ncbi:MAG: response regulator transcription factor [Holosporales bacterium]|jgi:two-component system cell cycle response regulator CtrA|nr:response regulator transcription factor [Holosporales bacterium]
MRLLVVEDDTNIAHRIEATCVSDGLSCHVVETGSEALEMVKFYDYDAVILDLILPDIDGFEVLSRIRSVKNNTPVIVLSGINITEDKVKCLTMGADDYLTKPFSKIELLARIYAIVRRTSGHSSSMITIGPLSIDIKQRCAKIHGIEISLTSKEYSILELLALKKGSILPKESFLNHIYGGMDEPELKIVDVFICKLRKKIADLTGGLNLIETVWGRGYTLRNYTENEEIDDINDIRIS